MIWSDKSARSTVVGCQRCPGVRQLVTTASEADAWARTHLAMHERDDETTRAVRASQARERRRDTP